MRWAAAEQNITQFDREEAAKSHRAIAAAIAANDPQKAEHRMRQHLDVALRTSRHQDIPATYRGVEELSVHAAPAANAQGTSAWYPASQLRTLSCDASAVLLDQSRQLGSVAYA